MQALPMVLGMGMMGAGQFMGGMAQRKQQKRLSQMQDRQTSMIGQAEKLASGGPLSPALQSQLGKYREQFKAGQAERGIFSSGVAAGQEAEVMPQIEQKMRENMVNQLLGIGGAYGSMIPGQAGMTQPGSPFGGMIGSTGAGMAGLDLNQMLMSMGIKPEGTAGAGAGAMKYFGG